MKRITKGFSGQEVELFPNMLNSCESSPSDPHFTFNLHLQLSPTPKLQPAPPSPSTPTNLTLPLHKPVPNSPWLRISSSFHPHFHLSMLSPSHGSDRRPRSRYGKQEDILDLSCRMQKMISYPNREKFSKEGFYRMNARSCNEERYFLVKKILQFSTAGEHISTGWGNGITYSKRECSYSCVDGILDDGSSWSMDVDTVESAILIALGATATETVKTSIVGGLKYSSNKGWNKVSQSSLFGGLQDC
ncbi:hypothetical protein Tco_0289490 [Tanacetum coccineum]